MQVKDGTKIWFLAYRGNSQAIRDTERATRPEVEALQANYSDSVIDSITWDTELLGEYPA